MKKKSNNKKIKLELHSLKDDLFEKLTDQESKKIQGGQGSNTPQNRAVEIFADAVNFFN